MSRATPPITDPDVAAVFESCSAAVRQELLLLRAQILDVAATTDGVGALEETLKWGQPSYLTTVTRSGSTIRIAPVGSSSPDDYAMYFICHTNLVDTFESMFGDTFVYERNRALLFTVGQGLPVNELRQCVAMALTYHLHK